MLNEITDAIVACDAPGLIKERAAELIEGWMNQFDATDRQLDIRGVEQPWYEWVGESTLAVGVRDLVLSNGIGEWKTHREARRRKDGQYYEGDGPEAWKQQMADSFQLALYASTTNPTEFLVRAAVKKSPPEYWQHVIVILPERARLARHCLLVEADMIRAARKHAAPWRFPDDHKVFGHPCICNGNGVDITEVVKSTLFSESDPGFAAIEPALLEHPERNTENLVILSASAYEGSVQCKEGYRQSLGHAEENENLQLGTCFHAGIAAYYNSMRRR